MARKLAEVGSRVAYSVQWLKSVGMSHSRAAHARGTVTALESPCKGWTLAVIAWDKADMPERVNLANLAVVGANRHFANVD